MLACYHGKRMKICRTPLIFSRFPKLTKSRSEQRQGLPNDVQIDFNASQMSSCGFTVPADIGLRGRLKRATQILCYTLKDSVSQKSMVEMLDRKPRRHAKVVEVDVSVCKGDLNSPRQASKAVQVFQLARANASSGTLVCDKPQISKINVDTAESSRTAATHTSHRVMPGVVICTHPSLVQHYIDTRLRSAIHHLYCPNPKNTLPAQSIPIPSLPYSHVRPSTPSIQLSTTVPP